MAGAAAVVWRRGTCPAGADTPTVPGTPGEAGKAIGGRRVLTGADRIHPCCPGTDIAAAVVVVVGVGVAETGARRPQVQGGIAAGEVVGTRLCPCLGTAAAGQGAEATEEYLAVAETAGAGTRPCLAEALEGGRPQPVGQATVAFRMAYLGIVAVEEEETVGSRVGTAGDRKSVV